LSVVGLSRIIEKITCYLFNLLKIVGFISFFVGCCNWFVVLGFESPYPIPVGRDSSVGIATRLRLEGPGGRIPVGARFSAPAQNGRGAHPASYTLGTGPFPRVKRPGRGFGHPPLFGVEVKERVELYPCSTPGPW
jgi:hypothetical protein